MTEHEYNQTEQRRTEGTAGRRYQQGGRDTGRRSQQGGRWSEGSGQTGGRSTGSSGYSDSQSSQQFSGGFDETSQRPSQQTSYGTGGQMGPGGQMDQQSSHRTGGEMGQGMGGRMDQQTGGQFGGGQMGGSQMSGSRTSGGQTGGQMGQQTGSRTGGERMDSQMGSSQMGSSQTSQGSGQMGTRSGQTGRQIGQMGGQSSQQGQSLVRPVTVSDVAATEVITVQPDAPASEVTQKMSREDVGSVVVAEGDRPVGIVTDRKIALALGETSDASQLRAADLMSEDLVTVPEGTNVFDLVRRLGDKGVRRVPVVDDRGDLKGIVSLDDVIVLLAEEFYNVSHIIRKQSPRF